MKSVKVNYFPLVHTLNDIYEEPHEPEALGISKIICRKSTISAIYVLDYAFPQVAKLSKTLQTEKLDFNRCFWAGGICMAFI